MSEKITSKRLRVLACAERIAKVAGEVDTGAIAARCGVSRHTAAKHLKAAGWTNDGVAKTSVWRRAEGGTQ